VSDLFEAPQPAAPLAERLRPRELHDVVGQQHLLGPGKPLRLAFESRKPHSMILWGPPGTGKTTLAQLMANAFDAEFIALSAVLSGVKDIRDAIERARAVLQQSGRHTILFVDEVHRFNKSQQDAFLPYVEQGLVTFIGATTENPSFEVNNALLSRAQVYVLSALSESELMVLFKRAQKLALEELEFSKDAQSLLIGYADGDARRLLNFLEQIKTAAAVAGTNSIGLDFIRNTLSRAARRFDKGGDEFYDQISALHKSLRGSDPDAALDGPTRRARPCNSRGGQHRAAGEAAGNRIPRRARARSHSPIGRASPARRRWHPPPGRAVATFERRPRPLAGSSRARSKARSGLVRSRTAGPALSHGFGLVGRSRPDRLGRSSDCRPKRGCGPLAPASHTTNAVARAGSSAERPRSARRNNRADDHLVVRCRQASGPSALDLPAEGLIWRLGLMS